MYELHDKIKIDAIAYPTILNSSKGTNFAIHPNYIDNHMELESIYLINYKLKTKDNRVSATRNPVRIETPENGLIICRKLNEFEQDFFSKNHHILEYGFYQ